MQRVLIGFSRSSIHLCIIHAFNNMHAFTSIVWIWLFLFMATCEVSAKLNAFLVYFSRKAEYKVVCYLKKRLNLGIIYSYS